MSNRILERLGQWVMADDAALVASVAGLMDAPLPALMQRARSLFATVVEAPEGMRIQTIHGFCQSLLRRFPVEAGIRPHFAVMDTRSEQELLKEARLLLFARAMQGRRGCGRPGQCARNLSETSFQRITG